MTKKIALVGLVVLVIFIFGSFYFEINSGPSRTQTARLDPVGPISVHLETRPDPPKPGGIQLVLHITDESGKPVVVDRVQYEYAYKDQVPRLAEGKPAPDGSVQAIAQISDVGEWQVHVTLFKGTVQTQVKFTLRVGANIRAKLQG